MNVVVSADVPVQPNPFGVSPRKLYDTADAVIIQMTLEPGQAIPPHPTPVDVTFYALTDGGEVVIGDEAQVVAAGTLVESPKNIPHALRNVSDHTVQFLVIKAPRPS